jgi:hypothetical protein
MALDRDQIERHVAVLEDFEQKYSEYLTARHNAVMGDGDRWSRAEWAQRERELAALATRADAAMRASGMGGWVITHPPAMGGGVKSTDLPSQVFDFQNEFMGPGDQIQQQILARIPSQIEGLRMRHEEAAAPKVKRKRHGITGRVRWIPPVIGFIVDLVTFVVLVVAALHFLGVF